MTIEKILEQKLRTGVKKQGGTAVKFTSHITTGMPDRMVLMPGGKIYFIELKGTREKQTPLQMLQMRTLRLLGFHAEVIDTREGVDRFLEMITQQ